MSDLKNRNVGLDVLRILLAFLVVGIHVIAPATGAVARNVDGAVTKFFVCGLEAVCYPAVNTYVILSGFFTFAHKKSFSAVVRSLGKLWLCLIFFSVLGMIVSSVYYQQLPTFTTFVTRLFPICSGEWWYMTNYFILMLISPMLNQLIDQYSVKQHLYTLGGALIICCIIPFFLKYEDFIGLNIGYGLIWFIVLYCTGAFLYRTKDLIINQSPKLYMLGFICMTFLYVLVNYVLGKFAITRGFGFSAYNSLLVHIEAILLFCTFYTMKVKSYNMSKVIIWLGEVSLASYVFHCQSDFGPLLWQLTEPAKYANSLILVPITFSIMIGVFVVSICLESFRKWLLKYIPVEGWINKVINFVLPKDLL